MVAEERAVAEAEPAEADRPKPLGIAWPREGPSRSVGLGLKYLEELKPLVRRRFLRRVPLLMRLNGIHKGKVDRRVKMSWKAGTEAAGRRSRSGRDR